MKEKKPTRNEESKSIDSQIANIDGSNSKLNEEN